MDRSSQRAVSVSRRRRTENCPQATIAVSVTLGIVGLEKMVLVTCTRAESRGHTGMISARDAVEEYPPWATAAPGERRVVPTDPRERDTVLEAEEGALGAAWEGMVLVESSLSSGGSGSSPPAASQILEGCGTGCYLSPSGVPVVNPNKHPVPADPPGNCQYPHRQRKLRPLRGKSSRCRSPACWNRPSRREMRPGRPWAGRVQPGRRDSRIYKASR